MGQKGRSGWGGKKLPTSHIRINKRGASNQTDQKKGKIEYFKKFTIGHPEKWLEKEKYSRKRQEMSTAGSGKEKKVNGCAERIDRKRSREKRAQPSNWQVAVCKTIQIGGGNGAPPLLPKKRGEKIQE